MAIKKTELYSSLWASCDELRGGMDASQYKDYVLFMLFIKYVTDKYADSKDFKPAITIPKGASFKDMVALKGKPDIGDKINTQVIAPLVAKNPKLSKSDFPDFNDPAKLGDGQARVDRLTNLIAIFERLDLSQNRAEHDDLLGDAYEYLMRHFATESGKSKGQFYTPAEVSRVIAQVLGISPMNTKSATTVYDPTCGSGSLLLRMASQAGKDISLEGQEKDVSTAGLARMNTILHGLPTANILQGDTLANPRFKDGEKLRTYDYVVANPPFSDKAWSNGIIPEQDPYQRFAWGTPPAKNGDYAYLLHIIRSMKSQAKAACILPHGVLFRGNAEAEIRKKLVQSGYLKGIIGLPPNLFYGTGIPACIVVLDKENAAARKGIFMIDASGPNCFIRDGAKNRLRERDIHRIVDTFNQGKDVDGYARMVPLKEIEDPKNDYNLNLPRYIDSSEPEDLQDIDAHLRGGIPERDLDALGEYWKRMPSLRAALFSSAGRPGYARLKIPIADFKPAILGHPEFRAFQKSVTRVFEKWRQEAEPKMLALKKGGNPKALIHELSESLLEAFEKAPLVDAYAVYQHLMDAWAQFIQDDAYLIAADGWAKAAQPREIVQVKNKDNKLVWPEEHDYMKGRRRFKSDLVPMEVLVRRHFESEQMAIDQLQAELATLEQRLQELLEDNSGEDGLLNEVIEGEGEKQKITAKAVRARLEQIEEDKDASEERETLIVYAGLLAQQLDLRAKIKAARSVLEINVDAKYAKLTDGDAKELVVEDKWVSVLATRIAGELQQASQILTGRIGDLAKRYDTPLPKLEQDVEAYSKRIKDHLRKMGAQWG